MALRAAGDSLHLHREPAMLSWVGFDDQLRRGLSGNGLPLSSAAPAALLHGSQRTHLPEERVVPGAAALVASGLCVRHRQRAAGAAHLQQRTRIGRQSGTKATAQRHPSLSHFSPAR